MSCGGRVYKGDTVTISVPFDVDDYSNLTITYTTIGGEKIVKTQEEVEIEDGFITYTFEPGELDLLPDGVIYYTIECEVNGVPNVDSTNTNLYLKTPAGYSGRTAEDIYQEGYEDGLNDCSGGTPCDCSSAITEAYQSGYTEGYNQGQEECSGGSCDLQTKYIQLTAHTQTFTAPKGNRPTPPSGVSVVYGGDYEQFVNLVSGNTNSELLIRMWNNGHTANFVVGRFCFVDGSFAFRTSYDTTYIDDILDEWTPINRPAWGSIWLYNDRSNLYMCVSLINEWFFDGYGKEDLILPTKSIDGYDVIHVSSDLSGSSCNLQDDYEIHLNGSETAGQIAITPEAGYDGVGQGTVYYFDAYNAKYNEGYQSGYTAGQADCSGETPCDCSSAITEAYQSGITYQKSLLSAITIIANGTYYRPDGYDTVEVTVEDTPQLEVRSYNIDENWNGESGEIYPNTQLGFVGFRYFQVFDIGYGQKKYDDGYQSGYTEGYDEGYDDALYEKCNLTTALIVVPSGSSGTVSDVEPPTEYAGFSSVSVNATEYGQEMFDNGFQSGYTAGLADCSGETPCDCTEAYNSGYDAGNAAGYAAGEEYGFDIGYDEGHQSGYTEGYNDGYLSGASTTDCSSAISQAYNNGHYLGYNEGKDSVIKSLLTENDTDLVIGYYYTSARTNCLITGEYHDSNIDYDGNSAFVSMSVNGGSWQPVEKYLELPAGWSQVRFSGCTTLLLGAFSHRFTPSQQCDMDALKIVSLPTKIDGLTNTYTFHMNDGLRVIASSCGLMRGATNGADNINVVITHYTGNQRQFDYFPSNGVLFIPEGSTADWASILPNWTHIEMF